MNPSPKKNYNNAKPFPKNSNNNNSRRKSSPKEKKIDVAPKNEVKDMFMAWFKKNRSIGQIMTKGDVVTNIIKKLDSKQDSALAEAMKELKDYGFIEVQEDGVTLVLTKKGYDFIS
ncbi:hypothetical protein SMGD1_1445 [Sulfurimonas gotlandica GD1]|uniref:Uncharacterized protein n=1 Tax=Sulfurimonas gotlandica (strain DSM 19862 / JCM 16533 / GD1) TaxID=929558 RepID=B6BHH2_SULGG|nr:hypothetical protein [Sulfurimonas gotlandica]EDZ63705.1 conserved hypothetical protein [Sulfurimonas gotlandica GD1]EHP29969.1 hypothetical protein SMGD1_1445 [Sulfurimonas gotlandica GD1]